MDWRWFQLGLISRITRVRVPFPLLKRLKEKNCNNKIKICSTFLRIFVIFLVRLDYASLHVAGMEGWPPERNFVQWMMLINYKGNFSKKLLVIKVRLFKIPLLYGGCSSVGRASDCGSAGRGFEPHHPPVKGCRVSSLFVLMQ